MTTVHSTQPEAKVIIIRALCGFHSPMKLFAITMDVNAWVAAAEPL